VILDEQQDSVRDRNSVGAAENGLQRQPILASEAARGQRLGSMEQSELSMDRGAEEEWKAIHQPIRISRTMPGPSPREQGFLLTPKDMTDRAPPVS
jgi:hypothetical protein